MATSFKTRVGAGLAALALAATLSPIASAAPAKDNNSSAYTFGVIGDVPYGAAKIAQFPSMITELNTQTDLKFLTHVGDIKAGSDKCTDEYFQMIRTQFDRLQTPLIYTPGDNEWVDCHRVNNGQYNPLERLDKIREVFFPVAGKTLGANMPVKSQANLGLPENVSFTEQRVEFAVVDVQGSNNSLLPWTGLGNKVATPEQLAEETHRTEANVALINKTFEKASKTNARGVVIMTQADMFDRAILASGADKNPSIVSGFQETVEAIAAGAASFDGPVYLFNGDSHVYTADQPLAEGSPWVDVYGVDPVSNLDRVTVEGSATSNEWLRVTVSRANSKSAELLSWERVQYSQ
ncbi:hypothetical protein [Neomicrococcus lactis]|uniref:Calcineurin-like phosphoesterase domain-containing protein n=1 Tax=Neomicrococcus lactis TaxID=732241 RepID=A0A7W8Y9G7_9MICC|nr:hypothetical protein [Neomicrococcus lactis]MBB5597413.1 hypothetical protein [Neomicrococcus lactis]